MELPRLPCRAWDVCLLKALLAEFMGTGIFLFTGLASITPWTQPAVGPGNLGITSQSQSSGSGSEPSGTAYSAVAATPSLGDVGTQAPCSLASPNPLHVSLAFGSSVALMSYCALPLSGGHLNPAVTVSMLVAVKVRPAWAMCYILAQLLGGITASALLYGLTPEHARGEMGVNKVSKESQGPGQSVLLGEVPSSRRAMCTGDGSGSNPTLGSPGPGGKGCFSV
ncbi:E3 ubiquitin-protein ligase Midline-1 [Platysternon megacephalum]|uniref:E3 ubiquitin-protein ligase Midline-1 n=1 Tax=Platysternon megacephalum TaxID=55544 RepID=A0A4D9ETU8_9SAUR|nr:E3 ubiquitin-protein ligase Midline-1 [Platysternon megacephalum]